MEGVGRLVVWEAEGRALVEDGQLTAGDAVVAGSSQLAPEGSGIAAAGECIGVKAQGGCGGGWGFGEELDAEGADAPGQQSGKIFGG